MAQKFTVPITVKQLASAGSDAVTVYVDQDTYSRLKVEAGGRLTWGSGASAGDVNLYRDSADVLKTDDTFKTPALFVDNIEIDPTGAVTNDVLVYNGSKFTAASVALGGGGASLTVSDTAPASPEEGDLWFNSSNAKTYVYYDSSWVEVGASGGVATLDDIGDVTAPSPSSGDFLKWNGTAWVNDAIDLGTDTVGNYVSSVTAGTGISVNFTPGEGVGASVSLNATLDNLSNVNAPSPVDANPLIWDSYTSQWVTNSQDITLGVPGTTDYATIDAAQASILMSSVAQGTVGISPDGVTGTSDTGAYYNHNANNLTFSNGTDFFTIDPYWGTSGQVLAFSPGGGSGGTWGPTTPTLDFLSDVSAASPSAGNVLTYNGSAWTAASAASGGSTVTASTTPPASPTSGSIWFDSSTAKTYVYYDSFWVEIGGTSGGAKMYVDSTAPSTPLEGQLWFNSDTAQTFAYYDSFWVEVGAAGMAAIAADAAPASPVTGQLWFNTSTGATYVYYDSYWIEVGAVAANTVFNLVDAKGDLLLGTADNTLARQAVGTNGQLLQANSATTSGVEWVTPTYAPAASPTFTGTVVLPSDTSIGTVSATELGYVDGVTSAIQTQLNAKANTSGPTFTNTPIFGAGVLSATVGSSVTAHRNYATYANGEILDVKLVKESAGPDWQTNAWMLQKTVDVTNQSYIKFNPNNVAIGNGATDVFYADLNGRIRMPYQPALHAFCTTSVNLGTNAQILFQNAVVNRGNCYNTSTSLFTAPVSGSYFVHAQILTANDGSPSDMRIAVNGSKVPAYAGYAVNNGVITSHKQGHCQGVVSVSTGDTISIRTENGVNVYGDGSAGHTSLVIFLLG